MNYKEKMKDELETELMEQLREKNLQQSGKTEM